MMLVVVMNMITIEKIMVMVLKFYKIVHFVPREFVNKVGENLVSRSK